MGGRNLSPPATSMMKREPHKVLKIEAGASLLEIEQAYHKNMLNYGFDPRVSYSARERKKIHGIVCEIEEAYHTLTKTESGPPDPFMDSGALPMPGAPARGSGKFPPRTSATPLDRPITGRMRNAAGKNGEMPLSGGGAYNQFFGFKENPFNLTPDPKFFYLSAKHKEALAHLFFGLQEEKGFVVITGEVGTGKTILCRSFLTQLDASVKLAYLFNPCLSDLELLQSINAEFGLPSSRTSKKDLISDFNQFLLDTRRRGEKVILVIDEAQDLETRALEQLRLLSNLETETEKLLQIVLVGQPELLTTLQTYGLRQLTQRITVRWSLAALDRDETRSYIRHRLKIARDWGKVDFTEGAIRQLFRASEGTPRIINVLADRALLVAYTLGRKKVNRKIANLAIANYRQNTPTGPQALPRTSGRLVTLLLALFFTLYMGAWNIDFFKSLKMDRLIAAATERVGLKDISGWLLSFFGSKAEKPSAGRAHKIFLSADGRKQKTPVGPKMRTTASTLSPAPPAPPARTAGEGALQALRGQTLEENRLGALNGLLRLWKAPPLSGIELKSFLDDSIKDRGLGLFVFDGDFEKIKELDYPIILELDLPGHEGKRYLAVKTFSAEDGTLVSTAGERIPLAAIQDHWAGKGLVVWKDFQRLNFNLKKGDRGPQVSWLQEGLERLGLFNARKTSYFGLLTAQAVTTFQKKNHLDQDGVVGPEMKMKLYKRLQYDCPSLAPDSAPMGEKRHGNR